ncbi:MAG: molybdopterin molybdotransferase MoeA [Candidatus Dormibacteria bacterium]
MLTVAEALARILAAQPHLTPGEVSLAQAPGLVLADDTSSSWDLPMFANSAMDGFAVRAADLATAAPGAPASLRLTGEVAAGQVFAGDVAPGSAVRIMTGAPIPAGADAVIEVEETTTSGDRVEVRAAVVPGRNIRAAGGDTHRGDIALRAGTVLSPAGVALLAAIGTANPRCYPRPRVAIIATGDELVDPGVVPGPGQVVDIVSTGMAAAVRQGGAEVVAVRRAADTPGDVERALREAASADIVVSVGGVSMGEYDLVRRGVEALGKLDFWRVAMRPGKPLAFGRVLDRPFIGLPGNPVSAFVGFEVFVLPLLLATSGRVGWARPRLQATLTAPLDKPVGLRTFARVAVAVADGVARATPLEGQQSFQLRSLALADALLDIPEEVGPLPAGALVSAILVHQPPAPRG